MYFSLKNFFIITTYKDDYLLIHKNFPRLYRISKKIFKYSNDLSSFKKDYYLLKKWGYLPYQKDNHYKDQEAILTLRVSEDCNLSCSYCYNKTNMLNSKNIKFMSKDIAIKAVRFFLDNFFNKDMTIFFFGGEPLLNFPVIKDTLSYIKKQKIPFKEIKIVTNGTILNKDILNFILENNIKIMVSLDLPASEHKKNRPFKNKRPSFDIVLKNLKILLKNISSQNILIRTTVAKDIDFNLKEIILSCQRYKLPLENLIIELDHFSRCLKNLELEKKALINYSRKNILNNKNFPIYKRELIGDYLYTIISGREKILSCPAGVSAITVNPIGEIYLCDEVSNLKEFYLGDIKRGIDKEKLNIIKEKFILKPKECIFCWARAFCSGFCPLIKKDKNLLYQECQKLKRDFIEELNFFLNLNYKQIKKLIFSSFSFTKDNDYISKQSNFIKLSLKIYKYLNNNCLYLKPINILPY